MNMILGCSELVMNTEIKAEYYDLDVNIVAAGSMEAEVRTYSSSSSGVGECKYAL